ncbi:cytochrome b5-related protein-like isoform X2 [Cimex lectularius]|uniref:Cytochrome b5-related protein n=1 Tax=Cimex lectularius TaxID=79782 RepID=A0A8I6SK33_CIMLE|nr:cytochrome b5-related protein-like isoform X2 [Cimex lectularius]
MFGGCQISPENESSDSWKSWKGPKFTSHFRNADQWMESRRTDEGAESLWRIHDKLYDLSSWVNNHPGGSDWIKMTQGTDITEAFEAHHISNKAPQILPKFYVRDAKTPRNAPFTFNPDGFYNKLKAKVRVEIAKLPPGPTTQSLRMVDGLALAAVLLSVLAATMESLLVATLAGLAITTCTVCAHNFFHQKDSWRMYLFSLSGLSVREWRISHALSHHLFTNTKYDLEVMLFEPILMWLPDPNKTFIARFVSWLYSPIVYLFIFHVQMVSR